MTTVLSQGGKIPATIVTGFLGAGKTTLIRNLLLNAGGRRIALIVNEFGDMGFDGSLLDGGLVGFPPGSAIGTPPAKISSNRGITLRCSEKQEG